jgi:pimeloyl-ACP methyl ester carboxylesterase
LQQRTSISRISFRRKPGQFVRPVVLFLSFFAILLAVVVGWSFVTADRVMRQDPLPLVTFNSNIMPAFSVVSFPSLDEQTMLYGWYMTTPHKAVSTIILVHEQGKNRLQFGLETPVLYTHLVDLGFNVLSFDLRNTGQSGGHLSGFGYAEWADVIAAIRYARRHAATTDVLLYGFGTGVSAALIAWDQLPAPDEKRDQLPKAIRELDFDQSYVIGLILDAPAVSPDGAIKALYRDENWFGRAILARTVPYAVRLSAGNIGRVNHNSILGACHRPVCLIRYAEDTIIGSETSLSVAAERERLHPDLTLVSVIDKAGHADGFLTSQADYLKALDRYLNRYFLQTGP